ncbi:MAG: hypothetical protein K2H70_05710, partial [Bacteroidales bacterium]|nr:hypothetical protein [Bacteroidales bacterium]
LRFANQKLTSPRLGIVNASIASALALQNVNLCLSSLRFANQKLTSPRLGIVNASIASALAFGDVPRGTYRMKT